jgi:hypothetical protein
MYQVYYVEQDAFYIKILLLFKLTLHFKKIKIVMVYAKEKKRVT